MRLVKKVKNMKNFVLYKGQEVLVFKDKVVMGDQVFDSSYYYYEMGGVLARSDSDENLQIYKDGAFEDVKPRYGKLVLYYTPEIFSSSEETDGVMKFSFVENGVEYIWEVETDVTLFDTYSFGNSILIFNQLDDKKLHFYTKTGERLWGYEEKEIVEVGGLFLSANEEIFESKAMKIAKVFPVVDDVVVIVSHISTEGIYKAQGFKIRTGEKLWELRDNDCPDDLFLGEDKKLYGCYSYYDNLMLYCIDPFSGKMEGFAVKTNDEGINVCPWNVSMHNNCLFYGSNRPGCELGVIDCGKRELVEAIPLKFKKGCQVGAPIVSDGKVYVFSRGAGELRVYEL
ncbi:MAG: hypothetical protein U0L74_03570 [Paludibacteraceae bacterium]|nr:hypothetical protein [Paludibacteraceae bacterium]